MSIADPISICVLNIDVCIADLGHSIVLKKNRGYSISGLENKLRYMVNLKKMMSWVPSKKIFNGKTNIIETIEGNVIPNPKNVNLIDDSVDCTEIEENCCFTLKQLNDKMKTVCKIC